MWIENTCQPQDFTQTANRLQLFQTGTDFLLLAQAEKAPLIHLWAGKSLAAVCWRELLALQLKPAFLLVC